MSCLPNDALDHERRCLLLRAAVLFELVDQGEMSALEACDRLHAAFAALYCHCAQQTLRNFERNDEEIRRRAFMDWRWAKPGSNKGRRS
jgi:hypothetical protein